MRPNGKGIAYDVMKFKAKNVENACESVTSFTQIPSSHKFGLSYFHSFGLSPNYIIFLEQSLVIDMKKLLWYKIKISKRRLFKSFIFRNALANKPFTSALKTNQNFQTQIHLIDRHTGQLLQKKFVTDPQFTFHHVNAFEVNQNDSNKHELIIDVCSYDAKTFEIKNFNYDEKNEEQVLRLFDETARPTPRRIRVPLFDKRANNEKVHCEIKDVAPNVMMELPTINYGRYNTKPYNYAYGFGSIKAPHTIVKLNFNNGNDVKQALIKTDNRVILPSEPIFVERPDAKSEDDGVVLTQVLGDKYDSLVIFDAKTLEEIGRAEFPENVKSSYTFHGFFSENRAFN